MNHRNITERQLARALKNTVYVDDEPYNVTFIRVKAKNASEHLRVVYPQTYGWKKGTIFRFKDEFYLIINRDATESDVYYTSVAMKCNEIWNIKGETYCLVAGELGNPNPRHGTPISTVGGSVNVYTNKRDMIGINEIIAAFGGWYRCINYFYIDGLCYYYFERVVTPSGSIWKLKRNITDNTFGIGKTGDVSCILAAQNDQGQEYYYTDAQYTYTSSDTSVATVSENGLLKAIKVGTTTIICTALADNETYTISFDISVADDNKNISITYNGENIIHPRYNKFLFISYYKDDVEVTESPIWTFEGEAAEYVNVNTVSYKQIGITINSDDFDILDTTLRCIATYSDGTSTYVDLEVLVF